MKNSFSLIALVVCALGVVLSYAFVPEGEGWIGSLGLKRLSLTELRGKAVVEADTVSADTVAGEQADTARQRVLLVGDSMVERLRQSLAAYCNANGHELTSVVWYSSSTENWAKTDTLTHFIRLVRPTHIFICLGGNELYVRDLDNRDKYIKDIKRKCGKVPTVWIGPPNWCEDTGINALLRQNMGVRAYFPSLELTFERARDGHHVTQRSADHWMDAVVRWMEEGGSVHPFDLSQGRGDSTKHRGFLLMPP